MTVFANRFARKSSAIVALIAIGGLAISIALLFVPRAGDTLADRADLSTAVATMFALFAAIAAVCAVVWIESADYKAEQAAKADTARLRAALRSIMLKWAVLNQNPGGRTQLDFSDECKVVNEFLSTTTAFGYWSYVEERGKSVPEGTDEPWRAFFLYIAYLLEAGEQDTSDLVRWAVRLEELLTDLNRADINRIGSDVADLAGVLGRGAHSEAEPLRTVRAVLSAAAEKDSTITRAQFAHLKANGVRDPNVDMFLAVFDGDTAALEAALNAGADPSVTDLQVLAAHTAELADFELD